MDVHRRRRVVRHEPHRGDVRRRRPAARSSVAAGERVDGARRSCRRTSRACRSRRGSAAGSSSRSPGRGRRAASRTIFAGAVEFGARQVVGPQRDERAEHGVARGSAAASSRQRSKSAEASALAAPSSRHREEARAAGAARPPGARARVRRRAAATSRSRGSGATGPRPAPRAGEPLGRLLGMRRPPRRRAPARSKCEARTCQSRRLVAGEDVAQPVVDLAAPRGRLELVGDLPQELVAEPVAAPSGHRPARAPRVDQARRASASARGPGPTSSPPAGSGRPPARRPPPWRRPAAPPASRRAGRRAARTAPPGPTRGPGRRGGPRGPAAARRRADELLEVQRDAALRARERLPVLARPGRVRARRSARGGPPASAGAARSSPTAGASSRATSPSDEQVSPAPCPRAPRAGARRVVEPVEVLGHEDRRLGRRYRRRRSRARLGDLLLELASLGGGAVVAGARVEAQDRRQQGTD